MKLTSIRPSLWKGDYPLCQGIEVMTQDGPKKTVVLLQAGQEEQAKQQLTDWANQQLTNQSVNDHG